MLGGKIKEQTKLLEKMKWIKCCIKTYSKKPYKREHYSIDLCKLIWLEQWIQNFESEKAFEYRAKQDYDFECAQKTEPKKYVFDSIQELACALKNGCSAING